MRRFFWLPALCAALLLGACGTDSDLDGPDRVNPGLDVSTGDTSVDTDDDTMGGDDTTEDTVTDAGAEDAGDDTSADTAEDVAADGSGSADVADDAVADGSGSADVSDDTVSDGSGDTIEVCSTGVEVTDGADAPSTRDWVAPECVTCPGANAPTWELLDFQPQSCGYNEIYGLDRFEGEVTVAFLWLATCSVCHAQLQKVEEMRLELQLQGITPYFVGIASTTSHERPEYQEMLTIRGAIPFFQSTAEVNAWTMMDGDKDDLYIYGPDGTLDTFLDDDDPEVLWNLRTDEGYAFVRDAIVAAWNRAHPAD